MKTNFINLVKWICMRAYWVLPCIYLMVSCLLKAFGLTGFNFYGLVCSVLLGVLCHFACKSLVENEFEDSVVDFGGLENDNDEDDNDEDDKEDTKKTFVQSWKELPWWLRLHWIPILGFLGITWWVMAKGLGVLFVGGVTPFVYTFSTIVTLTLLWILIMISRKKHITAFILLYLVFDGLSAFSFNFVEFYDNVSSTQHMDRDMKDCRRFSDIQGQYISQAKDYVDELHGKSSAKVKSLGQSKKTAETEAQLLRKSADNSYFLDDKNRQNKAASEKEREALDIQSKMIIESDLVAHADGLRGRVDSLRCYKGMLDSLTAKYRNDKQHFTTNDWQTCKDLAQQIEATLVNLSHDKELKGKLQLDTTSVAGIMRHLKSEDQDRFASLKKLFQAIASLFQQDEQLVAMNENQYSDLLATTDNVAVKPAPAVKPAVAPKPVSEEQQFENRLLFMSIMLSVLIDLLPLALGIIVAYCRPRSN